MGWVTSRRGIVGVNTAALPPGAYRLDAYLERDGKVFASAGYDMTIAPPEAPE